MSKVFFTYSKTFIAPNGASITFLPNVAVEVPQEFVSLVLAMGGILAESEAPPPPPPEAVEPPPPAPVLSGIERENTIKDGLRIVIARNSRNDFNAGGKVKPDVLVPLIGFKPTHLEIATLMIGL